MHTEPIWMMCNLTWTDSISVVQAGFPWGPQLSVWPRRLDSKWRSRPHWPFGARAGDRQVVCDGNVHVLLGIIDHAVDGIYVETSVFRAKEFGGILWRHKTQTFRVLIFVIWECLFFVIFDICFSGSWLLTKCLQTYFLVLSEMG